MMSTLHTRRWRKGEKDCWTSLSDLRNVGQSCWGSLLPDLSPSPDLCCSSVCWTHLHRCCCGGCGSDGGSDAFRGHPNGSLNCPDGALCHPFPPAFRHDASGANGTIWKSLYPAGSGKRIDGNLFHLHSGPLSLCPYPCLCPGVLALCLSPALYRKQEVVRMGGLEVAWVDVTAYASQTLLHWDMDREVH